MKTRMILLLCAYNIIKTIPLSEMNLYISIVRETSSWHAYAIFPKIHRKVPSYDILLFPSFVCFSDNSVRTHLPWATNMVGVRVFFAMFAANFEV